MYTEQNEQPKGTEEIKMTKAERIFRNTYADCKIHIENWGYEENVGFNQLSQNDNETVCTRTFNEIAKYIIGERKRIELSVKYNVIDSEKANTYNHALDMVQATLNNAIKSHAQIYA